MHWQDVGCYGDCTGGVTGDLLVFAGQGNNLVGAPILCRLVLCSLLTGFA